MKLQKHLDFIEAYRNYVQLSSKSETGIEFYFLPVKQKKSRLTVGVKPEVHDDRKKGFRF